MNSVYWRITYDEIGIYEALKRKIWDNNSKFSKSDWESFKQSDEVNWLKLPNTYGNNTYSYFTELGFNLFKERTYPLILKWLDKDMIKFEKFSFDIEKINLIYEDEHQIVIKK